MEKIEIERCKKLVIQIRSRKFSDEKKNELRNQLYNIMREDILKWMSSIIRGKDFLSQQELLSLSWDCFLFCLQYYKLGRNIPIPNHFYATTKFFLLSIYHKKMMSEKNKQSMEDVEVEEFDLSVFDSLDDLKSFKENLPEEYKLVFDDALMSMSGCRRSGVRRLKESPLSYYQYCEAKKIMKVIISFLLRR